MLVGNRVIGVICIQTYQPRPYGGEEQLLLSTIADQVAVAVQNARLYETVARELSERRRTEQELRESEEKFRNLAEQSPNMIFINSMGRVVYANQKCEEVMGYTREEFYQAEFDYLSLIDPEDVERVKAIFSRHLAGEEVPPYEYRLLTKANQRLDVIINPKLIRYENQLALLGIITDISSRKRTERLLQALNSACAAMEQARSPQTIFSTAGERFRQFGFYLVVFFFDEDEGSLKLRYGKSRTSSINLCPPADLEGNPPADIRRYGTRESGESTRDHFHYSPGVISPYLSAALGKIPGQDDRAPAGYQSHLGSVGIRGPAYRDTVGPIRRS